MSWKTKSTESALHLLAALVFAAACGFCRTADAAPSQITPQTRLRISIIQWMPTKGIYERWDALSGEFEVSQAGELALPVIGLVPAANLDCAALGAEIARRIQEKLVLVDKPDASVEILEYPPVYVLGAVMKPGEYKYREGMTTLQALALGGGLPRLDAEQLQKDIHLVADLQTMDLDIVRSTAAIARLTAENEGASEIEFPTVAPNDAATTQIFAQEKIIFANRASELDRQTKSLAELRDLLNAEIDVLAEKIKTADAGIASAEQELANVTSLVKKGITVASRQSELERNLALYRTNRLDQITATMRARQAIAEATRNADGLRDRRKTEVATALQQEQARLDSLRLRREASQKILLQALSERWKGARPEEAAAFTLTRSREGKPVAVPAAPDTVLLPGDVVTVVPAAASGDAARSAAVDDAPPPPVSEQAER